MPNSAGTTDIDWTNELPGELSSKLSEVRSAYFAHVDLADLDSTVIEPEQTMFRLHLQLGAMRQPGQANVRLHVPDSDGATTSAGLALQIVTDDMPLLVESVVSQLSRLGVDVNEIVHPILSVSRDANGKLLNVGPGNGRTTPGTVPESWMHLQLNPVVPDAVRDTIEAAISRVLTDVREVVEDTEAMRENQTAVAHTLENAAIEREGTAAAELHDAADLLRWLADGHYTLLGYRRYTVTRSSDGAVKATPEEGSGLGVLRQNRQGVSDSWTLDDHTELVTLTQDRARQPYIARSTHTS